MKSVVFVLSIIFSLSSFASSSLDSPSLECHDEVLEFKATVKLDAPISLQVTSKKLYAWNEGNRSRLLNLSPDQRIDCPDAHQCFKVNDGFKRYRVDIPEAAINNTSEEEMVFFEVIDDWNGYNYMFLPFCSVINN